MDHSEAVNGSRTALRQPFIDTANALASFYKQGVAAEREARDAGTRAAYMRIMEWAARKSRANERITPREVMNFCSAELASLPSPSPTERLAGSVPQLQFRQGLQNLDEREGGGAGLDSTEAAQAALQQQVNTVAYVARDDGLVSDIKKLQVNPRKRQRVDISDTFVSAFRDSDSDTLLFSEDGYIRSSSPSENIPFVQAEPGLRQPSFNSPRREPRDAPLISANPPELTTRRGKGTKAHVYDKLRRK